MLRIRVLIGNKGGPKESSPPSS